MKFTRIPVLSAVIFLAFSCVGAPLREPRERGQSPDWGIAPIAAMDDALEEFFNPLGVIELRVALSAAEWNALLNDYDHNSRNETCRSATVSILGGGVNATLTEVGFRERGNTSRIRPEIGSHFKPHNPDLPLPRFHFKLKFDETFSRDESVYGPPSIDIPPVPGNRGRELLKGVRALNLKHNGEDPSFVTEAYVYDLMRRFGVESARTTFARVWVRIGDEEERYMGVYTVLEDYDREWLARRGAEKDAFLVKGLFQRLGPADLARQDEDGDMSNGLIGVERNDPELPGEWSEAWTTYRPSYDIKAGPPERVAEALNGFMAFLASRPSAEALEAAFDVQSFLRVLAVNAMVGMADDYWRGGNNYYLWQNPGGKWGFIPFDYDRCFGLPSFGPPAADSSLLRWGDGSTTMVNPRLVKAIMAEPRFAADYRAYLLALRDTGLFTPRSVRSRFLDLQNAIEPFVEGAPLSSRSAPYSPELDAKIAFVRKRLSVLERECP